MWKSYVTTSPTLHPLLTLDGRLAFGETDSQKGANFWKVRILCKRFLMNLKFGLTQMLKVHGSQLGFVVRVRFGLEPFFL